MNAVNADIGQVHRQTIGDGTLDIQVPLHGVRLTEVRVHGLSRARRRSIDVGRRQTGLANVSARRSGIGARKLSGGS